MSELTFYFEMVDGADEVIVRGKMELTLRPDATKSAEEFEADLKASLEKDAARTGSRLSVWRRATAEDLATWEDDGWGDEDDDFDDLDEDLDDLLDWPSEYDDPDGWGEEGDRSDDFDEEEG